MKRNQDILTPKQCSIVKQCLLATCNGPFFRDGHASDPWWEFFALFGLTQPELSAIAAAYPKQADVSTELLQSIFTNLLGYPHGHRDDDVWNKHIDITSEELSKIAKEINCRIGDETEQKNACDFQPAAG